MPPKEPHAAADPDVKVPDAVKRHSARADEIHKAAYNTPDPTPTPEATPPAATVPTPPPEYVAPDKTAAVVAATAPPTPPAAPDAPPNYEHLYKTWKGRYDSELPRFKDLTRAQQERIAQLETSVADLQQLATKTQPASELSFEKLITEKEISDYGPELLEVIGKKAKEELGQTIAKQQRELEELRRQVHGTNRQVATSARERMYSTLNEQCPEWHQLNEDENFIAWLQLPDRLSGAIRADLLNAANERNDGPRVMAFFQGYLEEAARQGQRPTVPTPDPAVSVPIPGAGQTPQVALERLAAPGRTAATAATPAPGDKPLITRADISLFYANKSAGRYTAEQAQTYERMIWEAQREGRIR